MLRNRFVSTLVALSAVCAFSLSAMAQGTTKPGDKKPAEGSKMAPATKKAGPARDPKTGKFLKKSESKPAEGSKMAPAGKPGDKKPAEGAKKAGPARDPKTGRFIKKQ